MDGELIGTAKRRRVPRLLRIAAAALLLVLLVAFAIVWTMRVELASGFIDRELARRGVTATYQVKRIGFGTQVFENLVIGNPARPDLVARRVEVRILLGFTGPRVGPITARGVRMVGRVEAGRLRLGQVDRLLPPPSGRPFRLPDQHIDVENAAIALATPAGALSLALSGRGNLADGFQGRLALVSRGLRLGDCRIATPIARLAVRIGDERPRLSGPLALRSVRCGDGLAVERALFDLSAQLAPGLDGWRGGAALRVAALRTGSNLLADVEGRLSFGGDASETRGTAELAAGAAATDIIRAGRTRLAGRYAIAPRRGDVAFEGELAAQGVTASDSALASLVEALRSVRGTPAGPVGDALAAALLRAGRGGGEARTGLRLASANGRGMLRLDRLAFESRSGARLAVSGGEGLSYAWPGGGLGLDGSLTLSGGGFPETRFALIRGEGGAVRGTGRIAPIQTRGARLALGDIAFTASRDGRTTFRTVVTVDGPFSGGRVSGLTLPLSGRFGRGGFALGEGCVNGGFRALQFQNLRLGPSRLPLCPTGAALVSKGRIGAELRGPRFAGRLGSSPISLASDRVRVDSAGFTASRLAVRLGGGAGVNRLDVALLTGRFGPRGIGGGFEGLAGDLANVPLLVSEGRGTWRMPGGDLALDGRLTIADRQSPARFTPLAGEDFRLTLVDNRIRATGRLSHPASGTRVALATIRHDLGTGTGDAVLEVPELRFAQGFQPEALTPLTVGVVALVDGVLTGQGRIEWDARGSRSTGRFSTADMDLAAPFGPVEGLATTIEFTDLLGLTSAPAQEARVRLVRAGIDVHDGIVRYQIRPNYHVAVESARWPLAGGVLTLEPTVLDFSRESTKYLTFRVEGLDAARFIQLMEFSNIAATGTYDGVVPMQFTDRGGRIAAGRLVARPEGGTLSYVGELSDRDLGPYGVLAFDALKSLRYSRLEIALDGALDGEFLTRINMDGIARNVAGTREPSGGISGLVVGRALSQLARIPFRFNIRIEGRFRALIATARSFEDPRELIRASLPGLLDGGAAPQTPVQDEESEPVQ